MNAQDIFAKVRTLVADEFRVEEDSITMETSFEEDLGADSVDLVDLIMMVEDEFDIDEVEEDELAGLKCVGDCVNFLINKLN